MAPPDSPGGDSPPDDADEGAPVAELETLRVGVDREFAARVRRGIERRLLVGDLLDLAYTAPTMVLLEWITAPYEMLEQRRRNR